MSAANRALIRRLFDDGINKRDLSILTEFYSDCVYYSPLTGELRGDALRRFFASAVAAFPDAQRTIDDQLADDYRVVTRWTYTGTHQGQFMGIAPTGKRITITGISIHSINNGKIFEEWEEWDTLGMMQQLGAIPAIKFQDTAA